MPTLAGVRFRADTTEVRQVRGGASTAIGNGAAPTGVSAAERPATLLLVEPRVALRGVSRLKLTLDSTGPGAHYESGQSSQ